MGEIHYKNKISRVGGRHRSNNACRESVDDSKFKAFQLKHEKETAENH
jgi:hypothetical protein